MIEFVGEGGDEQIVTCDRCRRGTMHSLRDLKDGEVRIVKCGHCALKFKVMGFTKVAALFWSEIPQEEEKP